MIGCAYCGKIIGNEKYNAIETIALWIHVKNKHFDQLEPMVKP